MATKKFSILTSFVWKLLERGGTQAILFGVTIILSRVLTPDDYGTVALVMVLISLATVFVEGGLNSALIQKKHSDQKDYSTIFYFSLLIAFVVYSLLYMTSSLIAQFYNKPDLSKIIKVLGLCLIFNAVNSVQRAYLYQNILFKKLFLSSLTGAVVSAVVGVYMAYAGYGVWSLVSQQIVLSGLTTIVMWYTVKWRPSFVFDTTRFVALFSFGWKILISNLSIGLFVNIRSLIIGRIYNPSSLALFDKGKQFPSLIMDNINSSIQAVMFPILSNEQDDLNKIKMMVRRSTQVSAYILYPLLLLLAFCAKPLTIVLLTDKWLGSVPFIQIFCIANFFMPIQSVNMEAIKSLGYSNITLRLEIFKKVLELAILFTSVYWGVLAIAWGVVVYNAVCVFINLSPCKKLFDYGLIEQIKDNLHTMILTCIVAFVLSIMKFLDFTPCLEIGINLTVVIVVYLSLSIISKHKIYSYLRSIIINK